MPRNLSRLEFNIDWIHLSGTKMPKSLLLDHWGWYLQISLSVFESLRKRSDADDVPDSAFELPIDTDIDGLNTECNTKLNSQWNW